MCWAMHRNVFHSLFLCRSLVGEPGSVVSIAEFFVYIVMENRKEELKVILFSMHTVYIYKELLCCYVVYRGGTSLFSSMLCLAVMQVEKCHSLPRLSS